ncbi:MAG: M48 family metalloprotease [Burkholderiales bacterium]
MRAALCALLLASAALPARAQFSLDLNKLVGTVKKIQQASTGVDEPQEISIGRDVAARLLGAAPLLADERVQRYVNSVGRWLALHTERPGLPWHFGVLDTDTVNAFATPGGNVFITRGLYAQLHSEAELAGVLAHEISHVLRKHHLAAMQKNARTGLAADALSLALANRGNSEARDKLISAGTELYARGLDKADELEADRLGVVIAARAGYDAYGLPAVLQTLETINPQDSSLALMFKTHPAPAERLEALEQTMQPTLDRYAGQADLAARLAPLPPK